MIWKIVKNITLIQFNCVPLLLSEAIAEDFTLINFWGMGYKVISKYHLHFHPNNSPLLMQV